MTSHNIISQMSLAKTGSESNFVTNYMIVIYFKLH